MECGSPTLSTCVVADSHWARLTPSRFASVASTELLAPQQLGVGLELGYLRRPLVLHSPSPGPSGSDVDVIKDQISTTLLLGYGVTDRLTLDMAMPIVAYQTGSGLSAISGGPSLSTSSIRDMRIGLAYAILPQLRTSPWEPSGAIDLVRPRLLSLTARVDATLPTADARQLSGEGAMVWSPSLAMDVRMGRLLVGAESGLRLRPTRQLSGSRIGSQLLVGLGISVDALSRDRLSFSAESRLLYTFAEQHDVTVAADGSQSSIPNGKRIIPMEWALSVRTAPVLGGDLSFLLSMGGGVPITGDSSPTSPSLRSLFVVRYAPVARDTDGDRIPDRIDRCPYVKASGEPVDGCANPTQPVDFTAPRTPSP